MRKTKNISNGNFGMDFILKICAQPLFAQTVYLLDWCTVLHALYMVKITVHFAALIYNIPLQKEVDHVYFMTVTLFF